MNNCFVKYCVPLIFLGMLAFIVMLANFKPELLKSNFNSFIDMLQMKNSTKTVKESYVKDSRGYKEPSAFEGDR